MKTSKQMSYLLRHAPEWPLDEHGWCSVSALAHEVGITPDEVRAIAAADDKQRFTIDGERIRAAQGHTKPVDLQLRANVTPPTVLYHGTSAAAAERIRVEGLLPMARNHVHLTESRDVAVTVGSRYSRDLILMSFSTAEFIRGGGELLQAENGVWLTSHVPAALLHEQSWKA